MIRDRALPKSERERGNPFAPGLAPQQRAARLEGRKLITGYNACGKMGETMYRVDLFRRFLPRDTAADGSKGVKRIHELVQFWGLRATRDYDIKTKTWGDWTVEDAPKLHTVEVTDRTKIKQK